ncbi:hypothetical protein ALC56_05652, partial [Trachymyrmex septentrionalis]
PPRSCDLTPLDFFLLGYLKSQVYVNKPTTTRALKEEIQRCINEIQPHLCKMVMENFEEPQRFNLEKLRSCNSAEYGAPLISLSHFGKVDTIRHDRYETPNTLQHPGSFRSQVSRGGARPGRMQRNNCREEERKRIFSMPTKP